MWNVARLNKTMTLARVWFSGQLSNSESRLERIWATAADTPGRGRKRGVRRYVLSSCMVGVGGSTTIILGCAELELKYDNRVARKSYSNQDLLEGIWASVILRILKTYLGPGVTVVL